jgi:hypothetical protein
MSGMKLHMNDNSTVKDIQAEFSQGYPFLRMDFLKPIKDRLGWTIRMEKLLPYEKLFSFYRRASTNIVNVHFEKTVLQVIKEIEELLYVKVMVQRRSGNVWIETSLTAGWTLEQQNREGKYLSEIR